MDCELDPKDFRNNCECPKSCASNGECSKDETCYNFTCMKSCNENKCEKGFECYENVCLKKSVKNKCENND